jgi:hypothetical protein
MGYFLPPLFESGRRVRFFEIFILEEARIVHGDGQGILRAVAHV